MAVLRAAKRIFRAFFPRQDLSINWIKSDRSSWLDKNIKGALIDVPATEEMDRFEAVAKSLNERGKLPLWEGYQDLYARDKNVPFAAEAPERSSDQVRTQPSMGRFYKWFVERRRPSLIVEIGTAFGISAMYWAAGLRANGHGQLLTFDPNPHWQPIAAAHLSNEFGEFVDPVFGTFEENFEKRRGDRKVDIAFIDGMHTAEIVDQQFAMLRPYFTRGSIGVFDDIGFSDSMRKGWRRWSTHPEASASFSIGKRVGFVELH